jgi:large subunit ribosomal protein L4
VTVLKMYDISGKEIGQVQVDDAVFEVGAHPQSVKDYLVAIRNNARQWSASTKTRAEINRTGKKPHPQKGGGRSRQGDLAAPHYKGGGIVFGPKPKFDIHVRINKKERKAAIIALILDKMKANQVAVLQEGDFKKPKTQTVASFFEKAEMGNKRVLIVADNQSGDFPVNFVRSCNNLPKKEYAALSQLNGYALARSQNLVILQSALDQFFSLLGGGYEKSV